MEKEIANGQRQLGNERFLAKAPASVVEGIRRRAEELRVLRRRRVEEDGVGMFVGLRAKAGSSLAFLWHG